MPGGESWVQGRAESRTGRADTDHVPRALESETSCSSEPQTETQSRADSAEPCLEDKWFFSVPDSLLVFPV